MDETKIEFPCDYPIKVISEKTSAIIEQVEAVARRYDPGLKGVELNESKQGKYISVRLAFRATGEEQLQGLFEDLKQLEGVRMVL
jgi:putative lipoic acid-binding regulatory protein